MTEHNSEKNVHDDRDGPKWHNAAFKEGSIEPSADCFCRNRLLLWFIFVIIWLLFQNWLLLSFCFIIWLLFCNGLLLLSFFLLLFESTADCFRCNRLLWLFPFLLLFDCFRRNGLLLLFFYYHLNPLLTAFVVTASILIILANGLLCVFLRKDRRLWFQVSSKTIIQK